MGILAKIFGTKNGEKKHEQVRLQNFLTLISNKLNNSIQDLKHPKRTKYKSEHDTTYCKILSEQMEEVLSGNVTGFEFKLSDAIKPQAFKSYKNKRVQEIIIYDVLGKIAEQLAYKIMNIIDHQEDDRAFKVGGAYKTFNERYKQLITKDLNELSAIANEKNILISTVGLDDSSKPKELVKSILIHELKEKLMLFNKSHIVGDKISHGLCLENLLLLLRFMAEKKADGKLMRSEFFNDDTKFWEYSFANFLEHAGLCSDGMVQTIMSIPQELIKEENIQQMMALYRKHLVENVADKVQTEAEKMHGSNKYAFLFGKEEASTNNFAEVQMYDTHIREEVMHAVAKSHKPKGFGANIGNAVTTYLHGYLSPVIKLLTTGKVNKTTNVTQRIKNLVEKEFDEKYSFKEAFSWMLSRTHFSGLGPTLFADGTNVNEYLEALTLDELIKAPMITQTGVDLYYATQSNDEGTTKYFHTPLYNIQDDLAKMFLTSINDIEDGDKKCIKYQNRVKKQLEARHCGYQAKFENEKFNGDYEYSKPFFFNLDTMLYNFMTSSPKEYVGRVNIKKFKDYEVIHTKQGIYFYKRANDGRPRIIYNPNDIVSYFFKKIKIKSKKFKKSDLSALDFLVELMFDNIKIKNQQREDRNNSYDNMFDKFVSYLKSVQSPHLFSLKSETKDNNLSMVVFNGIVENLLNKIIQSSEDNNDSIENLIKIIVNNNELDSFQKKNMLSTIINSLKSHEEFEESEIKLYVKYSARYVNKFYNLKLSLFQKKARGVSRQQYTLEECLTEKRRIIDAICPQSLSYVISTAASNNLPLDSAQNMTKNQLSQSGQLKKHKQQLIKHVEDMDILQSYSLNIEIIELENTLKEFKIKRAKLNSMVDLIQTINKVYHYSTEELSLKEVFEYLYRSVNSNERLQIFRDKYIRDISFRELDIITKQEVAQSIASCLTEISFDLSHELDELYLKLSDADKSSLEFDQTIPKKVIVACSTLFSFGEPSRRNIEKSIKVLFPNFKLNEEIKYENIHNSGEHVIDDTIMQYALSYWLLMIGASNHYNLDHSHYISIIIKSYLSVKEKDDGQDEYKRRLGFISKKISKHLKDYRYNNSSSLGDLYTALDTSDIKEMINVDFKFGIDLLLCSLSDTTFDMELFINFKEQLNQKSSISKDEYDYYTLCIYEMCLTEIKNKFTSGEIDSDILKELYDDLSEISDIMATKVNRLEVSEMQVKKDFYDFENKAFYDTFTTLIQVPCDYKSALLIVETLGYDSVFFFNIIESGYLPKDADNIRFRSLILSKYAEHKQLKNIIGNINITQNLTRKNAKIRSLLNYSCQCDERCFNILIESLSIYFEQDDIDAGAIYSLGTFLQDAYDYLLTLNESEKYYYLDMFRYIALEISTYMEKVIKNTSDIDSKEYKSCISLKNVMKNIDNKTRDTVISLSRESRELNRVKKTLSAIKLIYTRNDCILLHNEESSIHLSNEIKTNLSSMIQSCSLNELISLLNSCTEYLGCGYTNFNDYIYKLLLSNLNEKFNPSSNYTADISSLDFKFFKYLSNSYTKCIYREDTKAIYEDTVDIFFQFITKIDLCDIDQSSFESILYLVQDLMINNDYSAGVGYAQNFIVSILNNDSILYRFDNVFIWIIDFLNFMSNERNQLFHKYVLFFQDFLANNEALNNIDFDKINSFEELGKYLNFLHLKSYVLNKSNAGNNVEDVLLFSNNIICSVDKILTLMQQEIDSDQEELSPFQLKSIQDCMNLIITILITHADTVVKNCDEYFEDEKSLEFVEQFSNIYSYLLYKCKNDSTGKISTLFEEFVYRTPARLAHRALLNVDRPEDTKQHLLLSRAKLVIQDRYFTNANLEGVILPSLNKISENINHNIINMGLKMIVSNIVIAIRNKEALQIDINKEFEELFNAINKLKAKDGADVSSDTLDTYRKILFTEVLAVIHDLVNVYSDNAIALIEDNLARYISLKSTHDYYVELTYKASKNKITDTKLRNLFADFEQDIPNPDDIHHQSNYDLILSLINDQTQLYSEELIKCDIHHSINAYNDLISRTLDAVENYFSDENLHITLGIENKIMSLADINDCMRDNSYRLFNKFKLMTTGNTEAHRYFKRNYVANLVDDLDKILLHNVMGTPSKQINFINIGSELNDIFKRISEGVYASVRDIDSYKNEQKINILVRYFDLMVNDNTNTLSCSLLPLFGSVSGPEIIKLLKTQSAEDKIKQLFVKKFGDNDFAKSYYEHMCEALNTYHKYFHVNFNLIKGSEEVSENVLMLTKHCIYQSLLIDNNFQYTNYSDLSTFAGLTGEEGLTKQDFDATIKLVKNVLMKSLSSDLKKLKYLYPMFTGNLHKIISTLKKVKSDAFDEIQEVEEIGVSQEFRRTRSGGF